MWVLQMLISFLLAISSYVNQGQVILASKYRLKSDLVAHTGFEPVISSLRGRCPKPLDECAAKFGWGSRIRTWPNGSRVRRPTARRIPSSLGL